MPGRRFPRAKWVLPTIINPPDRLCYKVMVPNEIHHIGAFLGAIYALSSAMSWQDDTAHTAKSVALVWQDIFDDLRKENCNEPNVLCAIAEMEYSLSVCEQLRFHEGKLQGLCCGTWTDIDGQGDTGIGAPGQPGTGAKQPPIGGSTCYHGNPSAKSQWLAPTVVNAGDLITFENFKGATNDGTLYRWNCPDGKQFFAGLCDGGQFVLGAPDPAPLLYHMQVICQIDGTWYDTLAPITVPGGVSNASVLVQLNDSSLTDNQGDFSFDMCVQNNAVAIWSHDLLYSTSYQGFSLVNLSNWIPDTWGNWVGGSGWLGTASYNAGIGYHSHNIDIQRVFSSPFTLTAATMKFNLTKGTIIAGLTNGLYFTLAGSNVVVATHASDTQVNGIALEYTIAPGSYSVDGIEMVIHDAFYTSGSDGASLISVLHIEGQGTDPFA